MAKEASINSKSKTNNKKEITKAKKKKIKNNSSYQIQNNAEVGINLEGTTTITNETQDVLIGNRNVFMEENSGLL